MDAPAMPLRRLSADNPLLPLDRLAETLAQSRQRREMMALMSFEVEDFEQVHERCGQAGSKLYLDEVARRASASLRDRDAVIHLGGEEFLVLASRIGSVAQAEKVSQRVLAKVGEPFDLDGQWLSPAISLGVALYPDHARSAEALVVRCFLARQLARGLGKGRYAFAPAQD
jgi:diguanylate cyclase (GGDEF)-like protein